MKINSDTRLIALFEEYPFLEQYFIDLKPEFSLLKNKAFKMTMGKIATLEKVSEIGGFKTEELISMIEKRIESEAAGQVEGNSEVSKEKIERLKEIIRKLHKDENFEEAKRQFDGLITEIGAGDIVKMEEALIAEGMPITEVQRLCSVHHAVVSEGIKQGEPVETPDGHPVNTYNKENKEIVRLAEELSGLAFNLMKANEDKEKNDIYNKINTCLDHLSAVDLHYKRKEYQLFPFLENKGFSGPSQVMWAVHDEIRSKLKNLRPALSKKDPDEIKSKAVSVARDIMEMAAKEESILFPMALERLGNEDWIAIRKGEDAIGYSFTSPPKGWASNEKKSASTEEGNSDNTGGNGYDLLKLSTGTVSVEQLDAILTSLPIDLSFVDENDNVRYYTEGRERIFPRSPGIIGRNVEKCHPPKSVHIVKRILEDFKAGKKDSAEFWIQLGGKFIHIRYFPIRSREGKYLGTLEFSQDITDIRRLEGERRLLNWDKE